MPKPTFFNLPESKRQLIVQIAIEEFAEHEYKNASISNIVSRAGIAKGSLYQYFDDKRELYFYLLDLAVQEKRQFLARSTPPDPGMKLFDYLCWLMREGARFELSHPRLAQVASRALFSDRPFGDDPFRHIGATVKDYIHGLIEMGVTQGVIDPEIDRDLAVFVFSTIFNEFGRYLMERFNIDPHHVSEGAQKFQERPIQEVSDELIGILRKGFAPKLGE
jgi:AcrR family transcriptional regulator